MNTNEMSVAARDLTNEALLYEYVEAKTMIALAGGYSAASDIDKDVADVAGSEILRRMEQDS